MIGSIEILHFFVISTVCMQHLALFILFVSSTTANGLSCISTDEPVVVPLSELDFDALEERIDNLKSTIGLEDDLCRVGIVLDYDQKVLTIEFTEQIGDSELKEDQVAFTTLFQLSNDGNHNVINVFESACIENECENEFLMGMIKWLSTYKYEKLQNDVMPLMIGDTQASGE